MKIIELYDGDLFDCQMIKNILELEGINSFLKDELTSTRTPGWRPGGGVKIMVDEPDFEKARSVVDEYEKSKS